MKTPDEIKKGLECCHDAVKCEQCPYQPECDLPFGDIVEADALAYIQQLEAENAELVQKVNQLEQEQRGDTDA